MLLGSLWVIGLMLVTIVLGVAAYNSEAETKIQARKNCAENIETLNKNLAQSKAALAAAEKASENLVADVRHKYEQEMSVWRNQVRDISNRVRTHCDEYNKVAAKAEEEVKRLPQQYLPQLPTLCISPKDIHTQSDYNACREAAQNISGIISQYHGAITTPIASAMQEYFGPLRKMVQDYKSQIADLTKQINDLSYQETMCVRKRAKLPDFKRSIPANSYGVPAGMKLYGSDSPKELCSILDAGDNLPLLAATLTDTEEPLEEAPRTKLRRKILQLNDWLPVYCLTYSCSEDEKKEIAQHNADIDAQIEETKKEQARLAAERSRLEQQRREVEAELWPYMVRFNKLAGHEKKLMTYVHQVIRNWSLEQAHVELMSAFTASFPQQPMPPDAQIREEERRIESMRQAVAEEEKRLPEAIAEEEKRLQDKLRDLTEREKELCKSVLLGLPKPSVSAAGVAGQVVEETVKSSKTAVLGKVKDIAETAVSEGGDGAREKVAEGIKTVKDKTGLTSLLGIGSIISIVKREAISLVMAYLNGGLIPCTLTYVLVGLSFWFNLVVADYLVCPLVRTSKAQEIAERMKSRD